MSTRRRAREVAMQVLFQRDQNADYSEEFEQEYVAQELKYPALEAFTHGLISGVNDHLTDVDAAIGAAAENWSVRRMTPVDRSILRLATYEICFTEDTPPGVAINEAMEVAKRYSTPEAPRFINGVLDRVAKRHLNPEPAPSEESPTSEEPSTEQKVEQTTEESAEQMEVTASSPDTIEATENKSDSAQEPTETSVPTESGDSTEAVSDEDPPTS